MRIWGFLVMANKGGRPSEFTQEMADEMCAELSEGKSLRTVCHPEHRPSTVTFFNWIRTYPQFLTQYDRAKQEAADMLVEEMLDIADENCNDKRTVIDKHGNEREVTDWEVVGRSKLRVDTRKWIASKLKPKKYGDRLDLGNSDDKPLEIKINRFTDADDNTTK